MRKTPTMILLIFLSVILVAGSAFAQLTGQVCSSCHTMHNSQNGGAVAELYNGAGGLDKTDTPQENLLISDCIGCHTGDTGEVNSHNAPIVLHLTCPTTQGASKTLAGGDFCFVATGLGAADSHGHNVSGLALSDNLIKPTNTPPGFDPDATPGALTGDGSIGTDWAHHQLTCAGVYGCHGLHTISGVTGAHHDNSGGSATAADCSSAPTTLGNSYRFLGGICGLENAHWNWNETESSHNEYYGFNDPNLRDLTNSAYNYKNTISYACAECHGYFHSKIDNDTQLGTPWLRHPTDYELPGGTTEYASYNPNVVSTPRTYSLQAPVAREILTSINSSQVHPGTTDAIVMCLSCHRAHGSPEDDILRWTYSDMIAGNAGGNAGTGCFVCHTTKD